MISGRAHVAGLSEQQLAKIDMPALVLAGPDKDKGAHPRHTAEYTESCLPNSEFFAPFEELPQKRVAEIRAIAQEKGGE